MIESFLAFHAVNNFKARNLVQFKLGIRDDTGEWCALGLLTHSNPWLKSAEKLVEVSADQLHPGLEFRESIYFLALQCLECTFKSFLNSQGVKMSELRSVKKYGHDLIKLLEKAEDLGIQQVVQISEQAHYRIELMNPYYKGKFLQYFRGSGMMQWPLPSEVIEDVRRIYSALEDAYRMQLRQSHA